jgi:ankyrin repeat protein
VVRLLLEKEVELDSRDDTYSWTPLSWVASGGREMVVRLLLEKGVEPDFRDKHRQTPLSSAAGRGHEAIVRLLPEKGVKSDSKDKDGRTPLWWAANRGREAVVRLLELATTAELYCQPPHPPPSRLQHLHVTFQRSSSF